MKKINLTFKTYSRLENHTRNVSSTSDEEVDYGSFDAVASPHTDSDHAWSTYENDSQDFSDKGILITKITPIEISSQYILILIT